jgi:hypothetical protein
MDRRPEHVIEGIEKGVKLLSVVMAVEGGSDVTSVARADI